MVFSNAAMRPKQQAVATMFLSLRSDNIGLSSQHLLKRAEGAPRSLRRAAWSPLRSPASSACFSWPAGIGCATRILQPVAGWSCTGFSRMKKLGTRTCATMHGDDKVMRRCKPLVSPRRAIRRSRACYCWSRRAPGAQHRSPCARWRRGCRRACSPCCARCAAPACAPPLWPPRACAPSPEQAVGSLSRPAVQLNRP